MRTKRNESIRQRFLVGLIAMVLCTGWVVLAGAQVVFPTPELPPEPDLDRCDQLVSLYDSGVHAVFLGPIVMSDPIHTCFQNVVRVDDGDGNEVETFDSIFNANVELGFGSVPIELTGPVTTVVHSKTGNTTETFDIEIVAMSLTGDVGGMPVEIRESPSQPSLGQTTITDLGGTSWQIDSFFDVFTEISVDDGPFMPAANAGQMVLMLADDPIPVESTSTWRVMKQSYR